MKAVNPILSRLKETPHLRPSAVKQSSPAPPRGTTIRKGGSVGASKPIGHLPVVKSGFKVKDHSGAIRAEMRRQASLQNQIGTSQDEIDMMQEMNAYLRDENMRLKQGLQGGLPHDANAESDPASFDEL